MDDNELKKRYLIRHTSQFRQKFDFLIIVCVIFNCFTIPIEIAFDPGFMQNVFFFLTNRLIDALFFLDMIVCFRTTFMNDFGAEVVEPKQIAINYIKGNFFIDFFATIPIDIFAEAIIGYQIASLTFFGLLKLGRLLRISKIIQFLNASRDFKAGAKLMKIIFFLVIYLHCFACGLWLSVRDGKEWVP